MKSNGNNARRFLRILPGLLLTATALWVGITVRNEPVQTQTTFTVTISGTGLGSGVVTDFDLPLTARSPQVFLQGLYGKLSMEELRLAESFTCPWLHFRPLAGRLLRLFV